MYLLAIFLPPLAVLLRKGFIAAVINLILCVFGFFPGMIHALIVVAETNADKRTEKLEKKFDELIHTQTTKKSKAQSQLDDNFKPEGALKEKQPSMLNRILTPNNVAWFFTFMFFVSFIGSLSEFKYLQSLVFLGTAFMISPATWKALREKSDDQTRSILKVVTALLVIFSLVFINADDEIKVDQVTDKKPAIVATSEPTSKPSIKKEVVEDKKQDTQVVSPIEKRKNDIEGTVKEVLKGKNNLGTQKYRSLNIRELDQGLSVDIEFNADDNITHNYRRKGMERQMSQLIKALFTSEAGKDIAEIATTAYFPLTDQYGNEKQTIVYTVVLDKSEADKINWDFDRASLELQIIPSVWEVIVLHPAIK